MTPPTRHSNPWPSSARSLLGGCDDDGGPDIGRASELTGGSAVRLGTLRGSDIGAADNSPSRPADNFSLWTRWPRRTRAVTWAILRAPWRRPSSSDTVN